ncbi:MAG TPA: hypothetical protein VG871_09260 [Vicinamibacterales bacterium]|nr:hypothetical protein [Vicinamibacterales bacterium]
MKRDPRLRLCATLVAVVATLPACGGKKEPNEPAVATPSVSFSKARVPIGSAVTIDYKWQVAPNATFDKNYWVFMHVMDPDGEQMWTDDHLPPTPTTAWKGGQTIEYTRTIFVPNYPYIGEANVRLGLYDPATGRRLTLNAQEVSRHEYLVTKFQILPSSENVFLLQDAGWYPSEVDAKNPQSEWQWTTQAATLSFKNPKKDVTFYLDYDARTDLFPQPQQATIKVDGQDVAQFAADAKIPTLKTFPITAAQLGTGDMVTLTIGVDRTFAPGGGDPRQLGIRVFHTYLEVK